MAFEITFGMLFFFGLILTIVLDDTLVLFEHTQAYSFTLIVGGFVLTSLSFNDLSDSLKSQTYLSLPASIFEKFLSMWLMTSMGWIVLYSFTYYLYTLVANPIGLFIDGNMKFENFDPLSKHAVSTIKYYFVLQGVFLVGAAHFKGYVFPKTLFTIILIGLIVGLLMYFSMYDLMLESDECFSDSSSFEGMAIDRIWNMAAWSFWWLLAPFCWVMTYLGLKDREV
ncbi:MAG: hypothetical protein ABJF11_12015 [Reichenbachiella sp.]|uniref:hypothetical protein n=1 Tax=Reichenbachiella sp. TaxID=2184521 RepID=UPI003265F4FD